MNSRPPAAVTEILFEALDRHGAARSAYLDHACGENRELRQEVESLLAVDESDGLSRFLAKPALENTETVHASADLSVDEEESPGIPDEVGPFRIVRRLGFGGMGTVYLARQEEPIEREVAVKIIHALHHAHWRRRFTAECQALARLNHPHIAALYEVGATRADSGEGLPYVAMELVDGEPINEWCDGARAGIERRLEVFLDVCSGISHAHQNGILHCDLKPANILVTRAEGRAKVIDFGIARAVDDLTSADPMTKDLLFGSPPYITPEMMEDGVRSLDTRTDVYALGLILYELLVGRLPFRASSAWLLMLQITEKPPEGPVTRFSKLGKEEQDKIAEARSTDAQSLTRRCRGDLDAIVLKAIDRDPDRRYGSPAELAADLRRHLAGEPIEARPPGSWELLARFLSRHKEVAIGVVLLIAALAAGFVARTIEARRANAEAQRANQEAVRASTEARRAQAALTESEQILEFMVDLFEAANPLKNPDKNMTVRELLNEGGDRLRTDLVDQPLARARLLQTVGSIHEVLGEMQPALDLVGEAAEIRSRQLPEGDPLVVESQARLGSILHQMGQPKKAEAVLAKVLDVRRADPNIDPRLMAMAHRALGMAYWRQGRFEDAEAQLRAGLDFGRRSGDAVTLAEVTSSLGIVLHGQNRFLQASELFHQALELTRQELGPRHPKVARLLNSLGISSRFQPTWKQAESYFRQSAEIYEEVYEPGHLRALRARRNLVTELLRQNRHGEAAGEAEKVLELSAGSGDPFLLASAHSTLGIAQLSSGRATRAAATLRRCLESSKGALRPEHEAVLTCRMSLAQAMMALGEIEPSLEILRDLGRIYAPRKNRQTLLVKLRIGEALLAGDRFAEAEEQLRDYLEGLDRGAPVNQVYESRVHEALGQALAGQGRLDESADALQKTLDIRSEIWGSEHPKIGAALHELGLIEARRGNPSRARELLQRAVSVRQSIFPPSDSELRESLEALESIDSTS